MNDKSFKMTWWMWVCVSIAILVLVFNFNPVGDVLEKAFGKGADKWAINIILVALIIYSYFVGVKKK